MTPTIGVLPHHGAQSNTTHHSGTGYSKLGDFEVDFLLCCVSEMGSYSVSWAVISPEILRSSEKDLEVQMCTTMSSSSASYSDTKLSQG